MTWRSVTMTRSTRPRDTGDTSTQSTAAAATGAGAVGNEPQQSPAPQENAGWTIFSYLIAGMVAYGLLGWLLATVTHTPVLLPLGTIAGLVVAIAGIAYKYGRA
jgi:F0F1-type ATP synthase assembly protein I